MATTRGTIAYGSPFPREDDGPCEFTLLIRDIEADPNSEHKDMLKYLRACLENPPPPTQYCHPLEPQGLQRYICRWPGCAFATAFAGSLESHTYAHKNIKPHACRVVGCSFTSAWYSACAVHYKSVHLKHKPWKCDRKDCTKAYVRHATLNEHIRTHTGLRPYACVCLKTYMTKASLRCHENLHHRAPENKLRAFETARTRAPTPDEAAAEQLVIDALIAVSDEVKQTKTARLTAGNRTAWAAEHDQFPNRSCDNVDVSSPPPPPDMAIRPWPWTADQEN